MNFKVIKGDTIKFYYVDLKLLKDLRSENLACFNGKDISSGSILEESRIFVDWTEFTGSEEEFKKFICKQRVLKDCNLAISCKKDNFLQYIKYGLYQNDPENSSLGQQDIPYEFFDKVIFKNPENSYTVKLTDYAGLDLKINELYVQPSILKYHENEIDGTINYNLIELPVVQYVSSNSNTLKELDKKGNYITEINLDKQPPQR